LRQYNALSILGREGEEEGKGKGSRIFSSRKSRARSQSQIVFHLPNGKERGKKKERLEKGNGDLRDVSLSLVPRTPQGRGKRKKEGKGGEKKKNLPTNSLTVPPGTGSRWLLSLSFRPAIHREKREEIDSHNVKP